MATPPEEEPTQVAVKGALEYRILGPLEVTVDGAPAPLGAPRQARPGAQRVYRTPMRSTTKTSVSSGPITPPAPRLP